MSAFTSKRKWKHLVKSGNELDKIKQNISQTGHLIVIPTTASGTEFEKRFSILYLCLFATKTIFLLEPLIVNSSKKPNQGRNTKSNPFNNTNAFIHSQNGFLILNNAR